MSQVTIKKNDTILGTYTTTGLNGGDSSKDYSIDNAKREYEFADYMTDEQKTFEKDDIFTIYQKKTNGSYGGTSIIAVFMAL